MLSTGSRGRTRGHEIRARRANQQTIAKLGLLLSVKRKVCAVFWGGVICSQRTCISEIFDFYVMMNTCYFCNQKKTKTLEHLEGYIRINKQVRAMSFNANLWVQRKEGREKEEENGRRQRSQLIKMLVLLCHCPWILWGPVCSLSSHWQLHACATGAWHEMGAEDGARRENKAWVEFFLRGIKYIWLSQHWAYCPAYGIGARLFLEEMNELTWEDSLNYSAPRFPHSPRFFVGKTEF